MSGNNHPSLDTYSQKITSRLREIPEAQAALKIAARLNEAGFQAVIAGGAVRDLILDRNPKDFDIATIATPKEVLKLFKKTQKVGIAFGVVLVRDFGEVIEVATFRSDDSYSDGRRPDSVTFTDAKTDASRRDFTINGLFYDIGSQKILDYVAGLADIEDQFIRAIGEAKLRFAEDYLRMLRAVRFATTLNYTIEDNTFKALQNYAEHIKDIAPDRVHEEFKKMFAKNNSQLALKLLKESKLLNSLFPEINLSHIGLERPSLKKGDDIVSCLSVTLKDLDQEKIKLILEDLRSTNEEKREILKLTQSLHSIPSYTDLELNEQKRLLRELDSEKLLFILNELNFDKGIISQITTHYTQWSKEDLYPPFLPTGKELISFGLKPGPQLGSLLLKIENLALNNKIHTKEEAIAQLDLRP